MFYTVVDVSDDRFGRVQYFGQSDVHQDKIVVWRGNHQVGDDRVVYRAWSTRPFVAILIVEYHSDEDADMSVYQAQEAAKSGLWSPTPDEEPMGASTCV